MPATGAEIFGNGGGRETGSDAEQRILVGGGDDDHRTAAAFFAERVEQFSHFAPAFANQSEDGKVGRGVAGHHADECAFPDAASAKNADALAASASKKGVNSADAASERIADGSAFQGKRGFAIESQAFPANGRGTSVDGISSAIEHSAQQLFAEPQRGTSSPHYDLVAVTDAGGAVQRHGENDVAPEADNLSWPVPAPGIDDLAGFAHGAEWPFGFDELADDLYHPSPPAQRG